MSNKIDDNSNGSMKVPNSSLPKFLTNPKLGFCTVTDVQCTNDLSQAKVYVTFLGKQGRNDAGMRVLNQSKGFIRSQVAKKIKIRKMPELIFVQDTSLEQGNKIENILKEIEK